VDIGVIELSGIVATISAAIAVPIGAMRWGSNYIKDQIRQAQEAAKVITDAISHKVNNIAASVAGIHTYNLAHHERTVKLEGQYANLKEGLDRVEHSIEVSRREQAEGNEKIVIAIREWGKRT
jgi:hypothetical protein